MTADAQPRADGDDRSRQRRGEARRQQILYAAVDGVEHQWLMDPHAVDLVGTITGYLHRLRETLAP